jgi:dynein heavy chain 2
MELELNGLTSNLDKSTKRVQKIKEDLDKLDGIVEELRNGFSIKTREAEVLRTSLEKALQVIEGSHGLLEKLSGEGSRWSKQVQDITTKITTLPRNTLISAAFIVYLANATEDIRREKISSWSQISNVAKNFSFCSFMSSESEQLILKAQGLPSDVLSKENAIILLNNKTTNLIIDPSGQATCWLNEKLKEKTPETISQGDENFVRSLELAGNLRLNV